MSEATINMFVFVTFIRTLFTIAYGGKSAPFILEVKLVRSSIIIHREKEVGTENEKLFRIGLYR